jgi:hypothetical protein
MDFNKELEYIRFKYETEGIKKEANIGKHNIKSSDISSIIHLTDKDKFNID